MARNTGRQSRQSANVPPSPGFISMYQARRAMGVGANLASPPAAEDWSHIVATSPGEVVIRASFVPKLGGRITAPLGFWQLVERGHPEAVEMLWRVKTEVRNDPEGMYTCPLPHPLVSGAGFAPSAEHAQGWANDLLVDIDRLAEAVTAGTVDSMEAAARYRELRGKLEKVQRSLTHADGMLDGIKAGLLNYAPRPAPREQPAPKGRDARYDRPGTGPEGSQDPDDETGVVHYADPETGELKLLGHSAEHFIAIVDETRDWVALNKAINDLAYHQQGRSPDA